MWMYCEDDMFALAACLASDQAISGELGVIRPVQTCGAILPW